jgi:uncharacterized protein (DUF111 family)
MPDAEANPPAPTPTRVVEWVVNLDDTTGELIAAAVETLLQEGALDVWTTPIQMKKQRPGVMLSVLCDESASARTGRRLLELTGSFGARTRMWDRLVLDREHVEVATPMGPVSVKVGRLDGRVVAATPEFEDVRRRAESSGREVRQVMEVARAAAQTWRDQAAHSGGGGGSASGGGGGEVLA